MDDPEEGLSSQASHPRFVAAAQEAFWYDSADDFSPFGNDTGNDTLRDLEGWLTQHGSEANVADLVRNMLYEEWGLDNYAYLSLTDEKALAQLHHDPEHFLNDAQDKAVIAAALGQLKITGQAGAEISQLAVKALRRQRVVAEVAYADATNPLRKYALQYLERLSKMEALLKNLT